MINLSFDNLDEVRAAYNPSIVRRATASAMDKLSAQATTAVSSTIRARHNLKARDIKGALNLKTISRDDGASAYLVYSSRRLSLAYFAAGKATAGARPKVKTARGRRYGAKVRMLNTGPAQIVSGAFWAKGQIFKRTGPGRLPIKKLTGPAVPQLARSPEVLKAIDSLVSKKADQILAERLNFYSGRRAGVL